MLNPFFADKLSPHFSFLLFDWLFSHLFQDSPDILYQVMQASVLFLAREVMSLFLLFTFKFAFR